MKLHIHVSETEKENIDCMKAHNGLSPTEYLDSLGVLGPHVIAAHALWLSPHDIELMGKHRVNCVHNINSNAKLASGYRFRYADLKAAGANICLGTDGASSSNNLDMLETMKTSALFQKAWREDPSALPLQDLMDFATVNGARALGLETGEVREGLIADLSIVDIDNSYFLSPGSFLANLIYTAHSDVISSVIAAGKFVMRDRKVKGEEEILAGARKVLTQIL
jgi:5-methylthioadenosine/S-adenosylhomocysteine deaminase